MPSPWAKVSGRCSSWRGTSVITSRGCPFRCTFCQPTLQALFGKKVRQRGVDDVLDELTQLRQAHGLNGFMFEDDTPVYESPQVLPAATLRRLKRKAYLSFYLFSPRRLPQALRWFMSLAGLRKLWLRLKRF